MGLLVSQNGDNPVGVLLQVVESEGKIALYGLQFATDSADLRPDSDTTLKQMSDVLHQQPNLKVFIVGHTDNSGSLEHNLALSERRTQSVVKALTSRLALPPTAWSPGDWRPIVRLQAIIPTLARRKIAVSRWSNNDGIASKGVDTFITGGFYAADALHSFAIVRA